VSTNDENTLISTNENQHHSHLSPITCPQSQWFAPRITSVASKIPATQQNHCKGGNKRAVLEEKEHAREHIGFNGREE
jgi:hypothetical protein